MIDVDLFVKTGEYVTTVKMPPFKTMPDAILWGERFFIRRDDDGKYYEGFVHCVVEIEGGK